MKKNTVFIIIGVVVLALVGGTIIALSGKKSTPDAMSATKDKSSSSSSQTADAVAADMVTISNYQFMPPAIKVKVGTTVTWTNQDGVRHNIVSDDGMFPSGPLFGQGETYKYTFTKAGTFTYHCAPHPYMHGTVVVTQ